MKKIFFVAALAAILALGFAGTAKADQLQVNSGVGTDPTVIGTSGFTMLLNTGSLTNLILLFSVPTGTAAPSGLTSDLGSLGALSLVGNLATSGTCKNATQDVYSCANVSGFSGYSQASLSLTNFNLANTAFNGITPSSYDIYEGVVTGANMSAKGVITISGNFGVGTFVDGLAANTGQGNSTLFTAFTNTGLTTKTPEPASLALLGLGLIGAPFLRRRK